MRKKASKRVTFKNTCKPYLYLVCVIILRSPLLRFLLSIIVIIRFFIKFHSVKQMSFFIKKLYMLYLPL